MKIKDQPALKWGRWLLPLVGTTLPQEDLASAILKAATCHAAKPRVALDYVELLLEQGDKTILVMHPVGDLRFAQRLCGALHDFCLGQTIAEIGEREAP